MPALTHGRVVNGYNLLPRSVKRVKTQTKCGEKDSCCISSPHQYNNMHPGSIFQRRRIPTRPCNRKYASTVVTGRSFAAKRAIARRVANCNSTHPKSATTLSFNISVQYVGDEIPSENPKWLQAFKRAPEETLKNILGKTFWFLDTNANPYAEDNPNGSKEDYNIIHIENYSVTFLHMYTAPYNGPNNGPYNFFYFNIKAHTNKIYLKPKGAPDSTELKVISQNKILLKKPYLWVLYPENLITVINDSKLLLNEEINFDYCISGGNIPPGEATPCPAEATPGHVPGDFKIIQYASSINCCCNLPTVTYPKPGHRK
jgi:hypothetical protein